jgi:hypothetical protein
MDAMEKVISGMRRNRGQECPRHRGWTRQAAAALALAMMVLPGLSRAQMGDKNVAPTDKELKLDTSLSNLKFGLLSYIDYSSGQTGLADGEQSNYNQFTLTRGYLNVEKKFLPNLGGRMTVDIYQDVNDSVQVGSTTYTVPEDSAGSWVVRVKYLYMSYSPADLGPLANMKAEFGMGHIPWLDFEEHVNPFRCQGTMAVERAGVFNSADLGISLMGNLGGKLEDAKGKTGNGAYDGKYGSWHLGVYNGSGFHAAEANQNKVFEGRISLRPLPDAAPGMQLSYFYLTGDGNKMYTFHHDDYWPHYQVQIGMFSFEHPAVIFTGQYIATQGNSAGAWVYGNKGTALPTVGQSYFLNIKVPGTDNKLSVLGRYDLWDMDPEHKIVKRDSSSNMLIYGLAYDIHNGNMIVVDCETTSYDQNSGGKTKLPVLNNKLGDDTKIQVVYQVNL